MGPSALFVNDGNPLGQYIWWLTSHHQLGQGSHCSHPTRKHSLVQGITKAYYKLPWSHFQSHLSWTQPDCRQSFKNNSHSRSRFWLFFWIYRWPFGHLWLFPTLLSHVFWEAYPLLDTCSGISWVASFESQIWSYWFMIYRADCFRSLSWWDRFLMGNYTYYCMPFPPVATGCDSLLTRCYLLWCNPSWVVVIKALWFSIRITRRGFFFLKKKNFDCLP